MLEIFQNFDAIFKKKFEYLENYYSYGHFSRYQKSLKWLSAPSGLGLHPLRIG